MVARGASVIVVALWLAAPAPALAQSGGMPMPMSDKPMHMPMSDKPAHFAPTRQAYTANHQFLVKLVSLPTPIPFEKYFQAGFAVYDGQHPATKLSDARIEVKAGMRHGMKHGFAHGMQSAPTVAASDGVSTVSGMYFHMMGPWVLEVTVTEGGRKGTATFKLPCCGQ